MTRKLGKVHKSNDKSFIKLHEIEQVAMPQDMHNSKKTLSIAMSNKIFKWSQGMFHTQFWTSQHICQFEIMANFLYNTVQEDNMDYPLQLTWIDNIIHGEDDLYVAHLLFVLTCSKHVCNATLQSLEKFVNVPFSMLTS